MNIKEDLKDIVLEITSVLEDSPVRTNKVREVGIKIYVVKVEDNIFNIGSIYTDNVGYFKIIRKIIIKVNRKVLIRVLA